MAEISGESQFFSGNIANVIPEDPLNKMVPLTEDHGGGGEGEGGGHTPVSSRTAPYDLNIQISERYRNLVIWFEW